MGSLVKFGWKSEAWLFLESVPVPYLAACPSFCISCCLRQYRGDLGPAERFHFSSRCLPSSRPALPCHCVSVVNHPAAVVGTNEPQCVGVLAHARTHTVNPQPFSRSSFELAFPSPGNAVTPVRIVAHKWLRLK